MNKPTLVRSTSPQHIVAALKRMIAEDLDEVEVYWHRSSLGGRGWVRSVIQRPSKRLDLHAARLVTISNDGCGNEQRDEKPLSDVLSRVDGDWQ